MDEPLESMYRRFTWRILSNYVTPWEFEQLKAEITDYEQWCAAWSRHAATHVGRGDAALAAARRLMEILAASFAGLNLPGYLRVPDGAGRPGIVLLLPGADSAKEELYNLADHILARGLAVAAFDGPGQGMLSFGSKLRPDQEVAVQAIIDLLAARPDLDGSRLAAEYGRPVTTVVYPDGVHILNNLWNQARPLVGDWLVETL